MTVPLAAVRRGETFAIETVPDAEVRAKLLRVGLLDGTVACRRRVRKGPVVIERGGTELALGSSLAAEIEVSRVD
ncbi:FeoA family protein [Halostella litorea]|uniref:FeoA family protein n=1 Tax=Halostella litorea TaxID=2528831 RepID=UPI0010930B1E|nr:FeoA family protein [Halostella litorea]